MEFIFIIESISIASGGPARVAAAVSSVLADRGHLVTIACWTEGNACVDISPKVRKLSLGRVGKTPFAWLQAAIRIRQYCVSADAVIVSGIWGPVDGVALRLAGVDRSRLFIRTCGMLEDYILRRNPWKKWIARHAYTDYNLQRARKLLVNTDIEKERIIKLGFTTPIEVIPNGVLLPNAEDHFERAAALRILGIHLDEHDKVLLYLGRIHPKKGLHLLLPGFAAFRATHPEWKLLVAGSFSDPEFQAEVESLSVAAGEQGVIFLGEVGSSRKSACFSIADCFALPSLSEGFPNAVVEALSWGIPSLVTPGCNFPSVAEYGAGIEVPAEEHGLLEGLGQILDEKVLAIMSLKARQLVADRYQLEQVVTHYEKLAT